MSMFPFVTFDVIENRLANKCLVEWGHFLGACNHPFGKQSFGLCLNRELVSVAVSASTVVKSCGGYRRDEVVELARLCSHPEHRDMTRVCLRLWRIVAPVTWEAAYWPVVAAVSYSNKVQRHTGNIYRFDGWKRIGEARGGVVSNWGRERKKLDDKSIWAFKIQEVSK